MRFFFKAKINMGTESERVIDGNGRLPGRSGSRSSKCICEDSGLRDGCGCKAVLIRWVEVASSGYPCVRNYFITSQFWNLGEGNVLEWGGGTQENKGQCLSSAARCLSLGKLHPFLPGPSYRIG